MKDFFVIGMTGPTGAGKSTVGQMLCERGFKIVDADKVARRVTEKGSPTLVALCDAFGDDILLADGELDRAALAKKAFADSESLEKLNSITHPAIIELIKQEIDALRASGEVKIILDAPQLFEAGAHSLCDYILSVLADRETRLERIKLRDSITDEQAISRINAQKNDEFFVENSDFVIYNNSDTEGLTPQIDLMLKNILEVREVGTDYENCQPFSTNPETQAQIEKANERPSLKKRFIFTGVIAACVVAVIACVMVLIFSNRYTKVIDKSLDLYRAPSVQAIEEIYPEQMWDFLLNDRYSVIDESIDSVDDIIEKYLLSETEQIGAKMRADFGSDWEFDYTVITEDKLSKDDCRQISDGLQNAMSREIKVSKGYKVYLSYSIVGSEATEGFMSFTAVKISGDWYVAENFPEIGWRITVLEF